MQDYSKYDDFSDSNQAHHTPFSAGSSNSSVDLNPFDSQLANGVPPNNALNNILISQKEEISSSGSDSPTHHLRYSRRSSVASDCDSDITINSTAALSTNSTEDGDVQSSYTHQSLEKQSSRSSIDELLFDLYDKHGGRLLLDDFIPTYHTYLCIIDINTSFYIIFTVGKCFNKII